MATICRHRSPALGRLRFSRTPQRPGHARASNTAIIGRLRRAAASVRSRRRTRRDRAPRPTGASGSGSPCPPRSRAAGDDGGWTLTRAGLWMSTKPRCWRRSNAPRPSVPRRRVFLPTHQRRALAPSRKGCMMPGATRPCRCDAETPIGPENRRFSRGRSGHNQRRICGVASPAGGANGPAGPAVPSRLVPRAMV